MGTISTQYYDSILKIFEDMGLNRSDLLESVGINALDLENPKHRIDLEELTQSFDFASRALGVPHIGLEAGFRFRIATFTATGSILAKCSTLGEAVELNAKYQKLTETLGQSSLARREDGVFIYWQEGFTDHERYRDVTELIMAGYVATTNWLSWNFDRGVKSVSLRHSAPADTSRYDEVFGCPVRFDAPENLMAFHEDLVDIPVPTASPMQLGLICDRLDRIMASLDNVSGLQVDVKAAIRKCIMARELSTHCVAEAVGMSDRNLRRTLKQENLKYRDLLEEVRQDICRSHMKNGRPFTEIAQILGYNDQSAFTRAFKGWYGVTPSQYEPEVIQL